MRVFSACPRSVRLALFLNGGCELEVSIAICDRSASQMNDSQASGPVSFEEAPVSDDLSMDPQVACLVALFLARGLLQPNSGGYRVCLHFPDEMPCLCGDHLPPFSLCERHCPHAAAAAHLVRVISPMLLLLSFN